MYSKETGDRATLMLETESAISRCLILVCVGVFFGGGGDVEIIWGLKV